MDCDCKRLVAQNLSGFRNGAFHGFDLIVPKAQVSQKFFARQCNSLRAGLLKTA